MIKRLSLVRSSRNRKTSSAHDTRVENLCRCKVVRVNDRHITVIT